MNEKQTRPPMDWNSLSLRAKNTIKRHWRSTLSALLFLSGPFAALCAVEILNEQNPFTNLNWTEWWMNLVLYAIVWLALWLACESLRKEGKLAKNPVRSEVAAISAGVIDGEVLLDLDYSEDSRAQADFNMVMTADGDIIELQGTGEERPFTRSELDQMLTMGQKAIAEMCRVRRGYMC